jgi:beta-lactamase regulating signal transducer with metallopeptidase domain
MSDHVETLNHLGENFWGFVWPMLWQSSLLIGAVLVFDWVFARRIRASVRYALWMVVLVKLILPPALALPTGVTWWLWRPHAAVEPPVIKNYTVSFGDTVPDSVPSATIPIVLPAPKLSNDAWILLAASAIAAGSFLYLAFRWLRVAGTVRRTVSAPAELNGLLDEARQLAGLRRRPQLKLIDDAQSPAVYGLLRPVILLPQTLANQLSARQLRAVLLHEAVHLRRGDVWANCAQTFLQIAYWWHPLLWLANARIRRVREEAVDDAVMLALREGADAYAPTLLEVAKFAFRRPLASLGLVGILESRSALRQRVERLVDFRPPRKAGITILSLCGIFAFSAVALPMGQGPAAADDSAPSDVENPANGAYQKTLTETFLLKPIRENDLQQQLLQAGVKTPPTICIYLKDGRRMLARGTADQLADIERVVRKLNGNSSNNVRGTNFVSKRETALVERLQVIHTEALFDKLKTIQFDISYQNAPLSQVLGDLHMRSVESDPEEIGINFMFNPNVGPDLSINPATGLPMDAFIGNPASHQMADCRQIHINLTLQSAKLQDVLNAICLASDQPIKYSVVDYGVVFSAKNTNAFYEMRAFNVNPRAFYSNLKNNVSYNGPTNDLSALAMAFFSRLGVNIDPPKTVFYNDGLGILFVYATPDDLDVVGKAVQALSDAPQQIHIKARFIEVPQKFLSSAGTKSMVSGLTNGAILSNPEFEHFLHEVKLQKGSEELAEPEVVTMGGRQTQMRATITQPVITGYTLREASDAPVSGSVQPYKTFPDGSSIVPKVDQVETGPVLDVVSDVSLMVTPFICEQFPR